MPAEHPRQEYPRPDFDRSSAWLSLNGDWDFAPDPDDRGLQQAWYADAPRVWPRTITVPFPWEHPASGVGLHWMPVGWYRRPLISPSNWTGHRVVLQFGAVHYSADVWINGRLVGSHVGGYLPFELDITDFLNEQGAGLLVVRVEAPLDKRFIPHGKQRSRPADDYDSCAFTPSSGIWQTVWLEPRAQTYISRLQLTPVEELTAIRVVLESAGPNRGDGEVRLRLPATDYELSVQMTSDMTELIVPVRDARLWSPADPHLYAVAASLESDDGFDRVTGYTGLRRVDWSDRYLQINGKPVFVRGVLDQGFWPVGGYTAPTDAQLRRDIELAKSAGYNLVRKHLKLEDPRWLYWADRLGMLVWAEPPSTGRFDDAAVELFEQTLTGMVQRDRNHPSIVIWGAYNEEWGLDWDVPGDPRKQEALRRAYRIVHEADPKRPVVDNSGWSHVSSDLVDWHYYDEDVDSWARTVAALTEGRTDRFPVRLGPDHVVDKVVAVDGFDAGQKPQLNGEYGAGTGSVERGWHLRWQTQELRRHQRNAGYIYTELYDVEHEKAGIYKYDRTAKDLGGTRPQDVNAETTLVVEVSPDMPGQDVSTSDGLIHLPVRVSHHGELVLTGDLHWAWDGSTESIGSIPIVVKPFNMTEPMSLRIPVPFERRKGRIRLWVTSGDDVHVADNFVDVEARAGHERS